MNQIDWKKVIGIAAAAAGTAFVATSIVAKAKKGDSVYKNQPDQKQLIIIEVKKLSFDERIIVYDCIQEIIIKRQDDIEMTRG